MGIAGDPSHNSGGATMVSTMCCTMCAVSARPANASSGDAMAKSNATQPAKNAAICGIP